MVVSVKPKVAEVVNSQLPAVIAENTDYLNEFLKLYYSWLDEQGVKHIRVPLDFVDIDNASEEIVTQILSVLLTTNKQTPNAALLVKNIRTLFENKGNLQSYQFLFNLLFEEEVELDWGRDHVLSASNNTYTQDIWITVQLDSEAGDANFLGMQLLQVQTLTQNRAFGVIDSQAEVNANSKNIYRFRLQPNTINGSFIKGGKCTIKDRITNTVYSGSIGHILGNVEIKAKGSLYLPGDPVTLHGGSGIGGSGIVNEVTSGSVEQVYIIDGGSGYQVGDTVIFDSTSSNATATVTTVDGAGFVGAATVSCNEVVIENGGYGFSVGDTIEMSSPAGKAILKVTELGTTGRINGVVVNKSGYGYGAKSSLLFYSDLTNLTAGTAKIIEGTNILGTNNSIKSVAFTKPSLIISNPKVMINGQMGEVWVSGITTGQISSLSYNTGYNYYLPTLEVREGVRGFSANLTVDSWGRINGTSIASAGSTVTAVTDTAINTPISSYSINVQNISKYKIGYGVVVAGKLNARVNAITYRNNDGTGTIVVSNNTSAIINTGDTITIYPVVLSVKDFRPGSQAELIATTDMTAVKSVSIQNAGVFSDTSKFTFKTLTGAGKGFVATPFFYLQNVNIVNSGRFYSPTESEVIFTDTHGSGADIRAIVENGVIANIAITSQGSGYTWARIRPSSVSGSGANLIPIIDDGKIVGIKYVDRGFGYNPSDVFVIDGDGISATLGTVTTRQKGIRKVTVYSSGSGYYPNDVQYDLIAKDNNGDYTAPFEGYGSGAGATFSVEVHDGQTGIRGQIKQVNVLTNGSNYTDVYLKIHGQGYGAEITPVMNSGAIQSVTLNDPGFAYWWDGSTYIELFQGVEAKLQFNIVGGKVLSVDVLEPGSGYRVGETTIQIKQNDIYWDPGDPTLLDYVIPMMDFYSTYPHAYKESVVPTAQAKITTLNIDNIILQNGGNGYSVIPKPLEINVVSSTGVGALLIPVIAKDTDYGEPGYRRIADVRIIEQGSNYDNSTYITITGGRIPGENGTDAELIPVIENGRIVDVQIVDGKAGDNYYYGTKIYVAGNGEGAHLEPLVNTGIARVNVIDQGTVTDSDPLILNDLMGLGAVLTPVWTAGVLSIRVDNPGTGYFEPQVVMGDAKFEIIHGNIESIQISSSGYNYSDAVIFIQGDGNSAYVTFKSGLDGAVSQIVTNHRGTRMGGVPKVKVVDQSNRGNISSIKIDIAGSGFFTLPKPTIVSENGSGAIIVPYGSNIGSVKSVQFDDFGLDYIDPPFISSQFRTILSTKQDLNVGEKIRIPGSDYAPGNGPFGVIREVDQQTNMVTISLPHIDVRLNSEHDYSLLTEFGLDIGLEGVDQLPWNWECVESKKILVPLVDTRMFGNCGTSGVGYEQPTRIKSSSVLNDRQTAITNHYDIQEFGYTIYTGIDVKEYSALVTNILHPAGYQLVGKVRDYAFADCRLKNNYLSKGQRAGDIIVIKIYLDDDDSRGYVAPVFVEGYVVDTWHNHMTKWNTNVQKNIRHDLRFSLYPLYDQETLYPANEIVNTQNIVKTIGGVTYTLDKTYPGSNSGWIYDDGGTPISVWEHLTVAEFDTIDLPTGAWYYPVYMDYTKPLGQEPTLSSEKVWWTDPLRVARDSFVIKQFYTLS